MLHANNYAAAMYIASVVVFSATRYDTHTDSILSPMPRE